MCGIAGFSGSYEPSLLDRMNQRIAHRGPDDQDSLFLDQYGIGLTHRRLTIIDVSQRGHQPMWDLTNQAVISFNGEIFNYRELRQQLEQDGFAFRSKSDTEVLLNLWLRDGPAMVSKLNGMFAFAIWDQCQKQLFLARDGVGVKPLYYAETPRGFVFASELKALLEVDDCERDLNPLAIHYHLAYLWCPSPQTMFKSVKKLLPGHLILVSEGRIQKQEAFYQLPFNQPIGQPSPAEAIDDVHHHLRQAVERQMIADVPVGAFLSGGLDSSSVVALAREFSKDRLQCFTIQLKGGGLEGEGMADDLPFARQIAKHLDVDLHVVDVGANMIENMQQMIYHMDEPQADPAPINAQLICRLARQQGIKVLLSGTGGDDIFTGYRRHHAQQMERWWSWLPRPARQAMANLSQLAPAHQVWGRRLNKLFQYAPLEGDARLASYFFWVEEQLQRSLYAEGLRNSLKNVTRDGPLLESLAQLPADTPDLNRMLLLEQRFFLCDHNLNYTDKASMAEGIEVRVPLLDPDLMACAARLPLTYKQRGATGKWIFKKVAEQFLPHDAIYRPKTGFGAPLRYWLRHQLQPVVAELLSPQILKQRGLFDPVGVARLIEQDRKGEIDGSYTIFSLMCMEWWCRLFKDKS